MHPNRGTETATSPNETSIGNAGDPPAATELPPGGRSPAIPCVRDMVSCQNDQRQRKKGIVSIGEEGKHGRDAEDDDRLGCATAAAPGQAGDADRQEDEVKLTRKAGKQERSPLANLWPWNGGGAHQKRDKARPVGVEHECETAGKPDQSEPNGQAEPAGRRAQLVSRRGHDPNRDP